jgi:hypothetical protein
MLKIDSRKAGLVHFCSDKAPFSGKRAALLQRAGIDNFIKPKMSTGSFGTDEKLKKTGVTNVRPALERPALKNNIL